MLLLAFLEDIQHENSCKKKGKILKQKTQNSKTGGWRFREASSMYIHAGTYREQREQVHGSGAGCRGLLTDALYIHAGIYREQREQVHSSREGS